MWLVGRGTIDEFEEEKVELIGTVLFFILGSGTSVIDGSNGLGSGDGLTESGAGSTFLGIGYGLTGIRAGAGLTGSSLIIFGSGTGSTYPGFLITVTVTLSFFNSSSIIVY